MGLEGGGWRGGGGDRRASGALQKEKRDGWRTKVGERTRLKIKAQY